MGNGTERVPGKMKDETVFPEEEVLTDTRDEWEDTTQEPEDVRTVVAEEPDAGKRADVYFAEMLESTRSHVQILLNEGRVCKGNKPVKPNYKIKAGDVFQVVLPRPVPLEAEPENIPLDIIYEDDDVRRLFQFLHKHLHAFFKLSTILRASYDTRHVKRVD